LVNAHGALQTAGVSTGYHLLHKDVGWTASMPRPFSETLITHEVSAVTGAFIGFRKRIFDLVGGFSETFPVNFNDIDFCMKVRDLDFSVIWTPHAKAVHSESASRDRSVSREEVVSFRTRWMRNSMTDSFYPTSLSLSRSGGFEVNTPVGAPLQGWSNWTDLRWAIPSLAHWDEAAYLRDNPDVIGSQQAQTNESIGRNHYLESGLFERRLIRAADPRRICLPVKVVASTKDNFDESGYLAMNFDVVRAIEEGDVSSAFEHFLEFGQHEGRMQELTQGLNLREINAVGESNSEMFGV
jgi:hypothetical protein